MRIVRIALLAVAVLLVITTAALSDTWERRTVITIQDTSDIARTGIPIVIDIEGDNLIDAGFVNANATDTRLLEALTERNFLVCDNKTLLFIPSLSASQEKEFKLYTGYLPVVDSFSVITGEDGYITISDHASLELGNDFEIKIEGWMDTSTSSNLTYKDDAFEIYTNSGDIVAEIEGEIVGAAAINRAAAYPASPGYTFFNLDNPATSDFTITEVKLWAETNLVGCRVGTFFLVSGTTYECRDSETIGSVAAGGERTFTVSIDCHSGDYIGIYFTSGAMERDSSGGMGIRYYNGEAIDPSDQASYGIDSSWLASLNGYASICLNATSIGSGEHKIEVYTNAGNVTVEIDGVIEDSVVFNSSVRDNSNDWTISIPYFNCYNHTVGVNHRIRYEPDAIIEGTVLPNEESPGTYDGTITWGTCASNVTVTIGETATYDSTTASVGTGDGATGTPMVPRLPEPDEWYPSGDDLANLPAYSQFNAAAAEMSMPVQTLYLFAIIGLAVAIGLGTALFTGSPLVSAIATGTFLAICVGTTVIGWWMVFVFIILGAGILYLTRTA